jgi:hypothetical protein
MERARNYPGGLLNDMYGDGSGSTFFSSMASAPCSHLASAGTPCFSVTIKGTTFKDFGQLKSAIDYPTLVDSSFKL